MKRYICAMSFTKAEALRRASFYKEAILEHMIKLVIYPEMRPDDVNHWINEIAVWLRSVNSLTVKPSSRPLKPAQVLNSTFECMGDELNDYMEALRMFQYDNKRGKFNYESKEPYPEIEPTYEDADRLKDSCLNLIKNSIPLICSRQVHSTSEFVEVVLRSLVQK